MKQAKRIMALTLVLMTVLSAFAMPASADLANEWMTTNGVEHPAGCYFAEKRLDTLPVTFEAWVYLPQETYDQYAGTIIGNTTGFTFEIIEQGVPQLSFGKHSFPLENARVQPDTWTHLAIVYGTGKKNTQVYCYLDGKVKDRTEVEEWYQAEPVVLEGPVGLAGDRRMVNTKAFKGSLRSVTMYADVRKPKEVAADFAGAPDLTDPQLLVHYDLADAKPGTDIADASGNGYDMRYEKMWISAEEREQIIAQDDKQYTYSIAFLPDIQYITAMSPDKLPTVFDYLIENKESENIQYLITLGDLTHSNTAGEWNVFKAQTDRLDGVLPYSIIRGNHDFIHNSGADLFDPRYSQPGGAYYEHVKANGGFYDAASSANTYLLFSVGTVDYIILNLDFGAVDEVLVWANEVLDMYSDRRAIIATHGYLKQSGIRYKEGDSGSPGTYIDSLNDGEDMWEKLIRKHANVDMVVCGHVSTDDVVYTQAVGDHGNVVHQLLMNGHVDKTLRGVGVVPLIHFTEDGRYARVEQYSTLLQKYLKEGAFWIELDFDETGDVPPAAETPAEPSDVPPVDVAPVKTGGIAIAAVAVAAVVVLAGAAILVSRKKKTK